MSSVPNACDSYQAACMHEAPELIPREPLTLFTRNDAPVWPNALFVTTGTITDLEHQLFAFVRDDMSPSWLVLNEHEDQ